MRNHSRRGTRGVLMATCALAAPAFLVVPVQAQVTVPAGATITLELRDARMEDAVTALTTKSGMNIIIVPGTYQKITLKLAEMPVEKALRAIAVAAGAVLEEADTIYYLRPAGQKPEVKPEPKPEVKAEVPIAAPKRAPMVWAKLELRYLPPKDAVKLLKTPDSYSVLAADPKFPENNLRFVGGNLNQLNATSVGGPSGSDPAGGSGPANAGGQSGAGRDQNSLDAAGQRGGFPGGGGGFPGGGFGGGGRAGGFGGGGQNNGGGIPGQGGPNGQGGANGALLPDGIRNLIAGDGDNSLIVQGDPQAIEELKSIIRFLDVAPKQIMVKAEFVSVNISDAEGFGIDWKITPAGNLDINFAPTTLNAPPSITMAYASGNAVAALRAAATRNTANILQSPIITTSNNMTGTVFTGGTTTLFINQQVVTNFGSFTQTQAVQVPVQSGLSVTPHINGDGTISMFLTPQLQNVRVVPGVGTTPSIEFQFQTVQTFRRLRNGETMVIGGFITRREDKNQTDIPVLSKLPIIGSLFTQKSKSTNGEEILIFITPTILDDYGNPATTSSGLN